LTVVYGRYLFAIWNYLGVDRFNNAQSPSSSSSSLSCFIIIFSTFFAGGLPHPLPDDGAWNINKYIIK